mgnify:CR=1 FL=1
MIIFAGLLILVTIGLLVVFYYVRKGIRFFRRFSTGDMNEEEFEQLANKYYKKKDNYADDLGTDYFKGNRWQGQSRQPRKKRNTRTTRTADGVTIVDHRSPEETNKKIFSKNEGEYVEFEESN